MPKAADDGRISVSQQQSVPTRDRAVSGRPVDIEADRIAR